MATPNHHISITVNPVSNHGYPYRAVCDCGWHSRTYVAEHAARAMGDYHTLNPEES